VTTLGDTKPHFTIIKTPSSRDAGRSCLERGIYRQLKAVFEQLARAQSQFAEHLQQLDTVDGNPNSTKTAKANINKSKISTA